MFTGIVQTGKVVNQNNNKLIISTKWDDIKIGESVCVNGVCLTVIKNVNFKTEFDLSTETVTKTTLGSLKSGDIINIERALQPTDRLGGHIVTGHIETVCKITNITTLDSGMLYEFGIDNPKLGKYIVSKGSIAVDGISLTIVDVKQNKFTVAIIPYTIENTNFKVKKIGDSVNIEPDILAKYLENIIKSQNYDLFIKKELTWETLKDEGFI